eukprot:scaffold22560_cov135-Cylindrotheca_fusiformis.AAC.21
MTQVMFLSLPELPLLVGDFKTIRYLRAVCLAAILFYTLRCFVCSHHLMTGQSMDEFIRRKYRILCTTDNRRLKWGSYRIRCQDLREWADRCAKSVQITLLSHEQIQHSSSRSSGSSSSSSGSSRSTKQRADQNPRLEEEVFDATVSIKAPLAPELRFGRMFLDVVDNYKISTVNIEAGVEVIVQNEYHAHDMFGDRKYHVVEHWYNSFPLDMFSDSDAPAFPLPSIRAVNTLEMATIWTNELQRCPSFLEEPPGVNYLCIAEDYAIETWYQDYLDSSDLDEMKRLNMLLADPDQGPGRLYYELFWKFNVLVVPVKTAYMPKLRYGNVQRAVSQMRSGVPVLLEIYGEVLEDFMAKYNYTCAYIMNNTTLKKNRHYWTFEEAAEAMKSVDIRRQCQGEGLRIARDYAPSEIAKKHLRALGFEGEFECDSNTRHFAFF